jgi:hypothetical protein
LTVTLNVDRKQPHVRNHRLDRRSDLGATSNDICDAFGDLKNFADCRPELLAVFSLRRRPSS